MESLVMDKPEPMTAEEILQAALAREEQARDLYAELAAQCRIDFVRELLERLRDEEAKHARLLQEIITRLNRGQDLVSATSGPSIGRLVARMSPDES